MRRWAIICAMLLGLPSWATVRSMSLEEAVNLAINQNKEIQAAQSQEEGATYQYHSSWGKFFPQVSAEAKYTMLDKPIEIDLTSIRTAMIQSSAGAAKAGPTAMGSAAAGAGASTALTSQLESSLPPFKEKVQKDHYTNATLLVTQPVFTGGKLTSNMLAKKEGVRLAQNETRSVRNKVVAEAVTRYFAVQLMQQVKEVKKEALDGFMEHESYASKLLKEGQLSRAQKMRADVAVAEGQREYAKAQKDFELAVILLNNTLGTGNEFFDLQTPLFLSEQVVSEEDYLRDALEHNTNIEMLEHKSVMLDKKHDVIRGNFMPTVGLFLKYEMEKKYLTTLEPEWAAGVNVKMALFDGGSDYYDLRAVTMEQAAVSYLSQNVKELVRTEIKKYYHDLTTAKDQHKSLQTSKELAQENLRLNKLSFKEGAATALDVIDAQLALEKVKTEELKALYDFDVALANLLRASGDAAKILQFK